MAFKKNYFKGLQGGVNHSPLKMHDGKPHSKKDFKGLLAHKLASKEPVVNERLQNQNTSDNLTVEKFRKNNNISSENLKNNAAVIKERKVRKIQENQNKNRASISQGAVTEQEKEQAAIESKRGEEINNASLSLLERPLAYLNDPSAVLGDMGINSFLGFDTENTTQLAKDIETMRQDPNLSYFDKLKAKTKMGVDMVPAATVNTALGMIGAGGVGTGVKGATSYMGNVLNNTVNPLAGLGKPALNTLSKALTNNVDDAGVDAIQKAINIQKGTDNVVYNLDNVKIGDGFDFDLSNLPSRANSSNEIPNFINRRLRRKDDALGNRLEPLARELSKGANTFKEAKEFAAKNFESPQGKKRLDDLIRETIDNKTKIPANLSFLKDYEFPASMSAKNKQKYVDYFAKKHKDKLLNTESINERLANEAFDANGNYNPRKAVDIIYSTVDTKKVGADKGKQILDFNDSYLKNNAFMLDNSTVGIADVAEPNFALGTNYTESSPTAYHELFGHGSQTIHGLGAIDADRRLLSLNQTPDAGGGQWYFNTGNSDKYKSMFANSTATSKEPYAFAQELRKAMYDKGILKNNNGTWETVTPEMLKKAKTVFDKSPAGTMIPGGGFMSDTRLLNFIEDFDGLSTEMNKLIGANNPGDADGKNKFDMLKANSMEVNA